MSERLHHLDALRAGAMLLGIALHGALAYSGGPWIVRDEPNAAFGVVFLAIHGFRMQLFFLLSGYFTALLWRRRGLRGLLANRAQRIALPLVVGLVTVIPAGWAVIVWASSTGADQPLAMPEAEAAGVAPHPTDAVSTQADADGSGQPGPLGIALFLLFRFPIWQHLWFLWFLCWFVPSFALVVALLRSRVATPIRSRLVAAARAMRLAVGSGLALAWLVPLTVLSCACMDLTRQESVFGADTSAGILPLPGVLGHYAIFFAFGVALYEVSGALAGFTRGWWIALPASAAAFLIGSAFVYEVPWTRALVASDGLHRLVAWLGASLYAWLMSMGLLGLFARCLHGENRLARYLSESSYWMYLAHLPLVVALQILLRGLDWPPIVKFAVLAAASMAILLASYEWWVRRTWIGVLLNGRRS